MTTRRINVNGKQVDIEVDEVMDWIDHLRQHGRKENTLRTYVNNASMCLACLKLDGRSTRAADITPDDIRFLFRNVAVKEGVRRAYLRSLSCMVEHHTGRGLVKQANILYNREVRDRTFISKDDFVSAYMMADGFQRIIMYLGAYMGLRRGEMAGIRDCDLVGDTLTVHGKGHGSDGLVSTVRVPGPVLEEIARYRASPMKEGSAHDDFLLQTRDHRGVLHRTNVSKISDSMTALGKASGVHITTHSLRRFYATVLYYDAECDLQTLRALMRHADVSTTLKCYVDANDEKARKASKRLEGMMNGLTREGDKKRDEEGRGGRKG